MYLLAAIAGLIFGSFGTVLRTRLAADESLVSPRSHCRNCNTTLHWYDNLPLISYILLRGKCRSCQSRIPIEYPLIELSTALLFLIVVMRFGITGEGIPLAALAVVTPPLIAIDIEQKRLPNVMTMALLAIAFVVALAYALTSSYDRASNAVIVAAVLGLSFLLLRFISRGGMGLGDVKLVAGLGIALGLISWKTPITGVIIAFVLASLASIPLIFKGQLKRAIPFGPYLLVGAWIAVAGGSSLNEIVLGLWGVR